MPCGAVKIVPHLIWFQGLVIIQTDRSLIAVADKNYIIFIVHFTCLIVFYISLGPLQPV